MEIKQVTSNNDTHRNISARLAPPLPMTCFVFCVMKRTFDLKERTSDIATKNHTFQHWVITCFYGMLKKETIWNTPNENHNFA